MNNTKRRCRNCEFANSRITRWPFVFCYLKGYMKLRCSRCKFHYPKTKHNKHAMKAPRIIRRMLRVEYRLTTISHGKAVNVYCTDRKTLKGTLARMTDIEYWTLYKRGPLWLPERTVDFGQKD